MTNYNSQIEKKLYQVSAHCIPWLHLIKLPIKTEEGTLGASPSQPSVSLASRFHCTINQNYAVVLFCYSGGQPIIQTLVSSEAFYPSPLTSLPQFFNIQAVISNPRKQVGRNDEVVVEKHTLQYTLEDVDVVSTSEELQKGSKNKQAW